MFGVSGFLTTGVVLMFHDGFRNPNALSPVSLRVRDVQKQEVCVAQAVGVGGAGYDVWA